MNPYLFFERKFGKTLRGIFVEIVKEQWLFYTHPINKLANLGKNLKQLELQVNFLYVQDLAIGVT